MMNLIAHSESIDKDFTSLYFAEYMQRLWMVTVGYGKNLPPMYLVNMRKRLCDWQVLNSVDCDGEYAAASRVLQSELLIYPVLGTSGTCALTVASRWSGCCF